MMMSRKEIRSGAEALAATGAARSENLAAADGGETGTEAVAALAHQFRGLISALHGSYSE
jgi:2-methylisocitrate lyase-like PEP mutase family enzyme